MNAGMILVFKTSLRTKRDCLQLAPLLNSQAGIDQWTVDLTDCDKVLRIVSKDAMAPTIETIVRSIGFDCCELTD